MSWEVVEQTLERVRARELIELDTAGSLRAEVEFRDAIDYDVVIGAMPLTIAYRVANEVLELALWSTDAETVHMTAQVTSLR